jgi:hypothetical protein
MQPASSRVESHRSIWQLTSYMISVISLMMGKHANLKSIIKDCTCPTLLHYYSHARKSKTQEARAETAVKLFIDIEYRHE